MGRINISLYVSILHNKKKFPKYWSILPPLRLEITLQLYTQQSLITDAQKEQRTRRISTGGAIAAIVYERAVVHFARAKRGLRFSSPRMREKKRRSTVFGYTPPRRLMLTMRRRGIILLSCVIASLPLCLSLSIPLSARKYFVVGGGKESCDTGLSA